MAGNEAICDLRTDEAARCSRKVDRLNHAVFGNGEPEKSILVRLDCVEKKLGTISKVSWATLGGVGTLVMKILGSWLGA